MPPRFINEQQTRKQMIDPQLEKAGWYLRERGKVGIEIPVDGYNAEPFNGVTDYCLYRENGEVLAVVEAKRATTDVRLAQAQAEHYVNEIARHQTTRPYAFLANGYEIHFLDANGAAPRLVAGFFSRADLENRLYLQTHALPFASIEINNDIVDRAYQHEAIRRACEAFEGGRRKALIVMATGTGKTRTTMALIDLFLRANQARNILFVADRDALVEQAKSDGFERFLPHEPCTRLRSYEIDTSQRLYAVTLQTLSNIYAQFSPAFFDLIVFDEVHRSIFNKFNEVLQYFDGRMVGLTATPAQYIDRDTFREFECHDGRPTYLYTYEIAVEEGYLVDYDLYSAQTRFQRQGIRGVDLSEEERNALIQQGIDPDELDYEGSELEKTVSNRDTLRRQWEELWDTCIKDPAGLPGKTILFAITQQHALRLQEAFHEMYPQFPALVRVITHKSEYRGTLVEKFKREDQPRIAISVDMLDTGIDVPEVVNLAFMKPVQSPIKLQQMIGRGTRSNAACRYPERLPAGGKQRFLVIDFWENNFSRAPREPVETALPVLVSLFNTRLRLLETYLHEQSTEECHSVIADLRAMIDRIPRESFTVRRALAGIEQAWEDAFWYHLTPQKLEFLRLKVGPLLRFAPDVDVSAETFTSKIERLKWQLRTDRDTEASLSAVLEDIYSLPENLLNAEQLALRERCRAETLQEADMPTLNRIRDAFAPQMKYRQREPTFLTLDLPDFIALSGYILLTGSGEKLYVAEYRRMVEARILALAAEHPTLQAIGRGEPIDDAQLLALERTLHQTLAGGDLELSPENIRKAYGLRVDSFLGFLRHVLELDALPDYSELVHRQFEAYITTHRYSADQINFLRVVQSIFLQRRRLELADLYEPPLTRFGLGAVERWFSAHEVEEIIAFANGLSV